MRLSWVGAVGDGGEAPIGVTVSSPTSEEGVVGVVVDGVSSLVMIQYHSENLPDFYFCLKTIDKKKEGPIAMVLFCFFEFIVQREGANFSP